MMRKIAVALLLVSLAVPTASALPRGDDSDTFGVFGSRIAKVIKFVVHALDDFWPEPPKP